MAYWNQNSNLKEQEEIFPWALLWVVIARREYLTGYIKNLAVHQDGCYQN